jgi:hypothetical protein
MSELTTCNFCNLKRIRREAKREGKVVRLRKDKTYDGTNVYVLDKGESIIHDKHFAAWMMKITEKCCC